MAKIMSEEYELMRVNCFEKTGCLLTWLPSETHDDKVKPQCIAEGLMKVPKTRSVREEQTNEMPEG